MLLYKVSNLLELDVVPRSELPQTEAMECARVDQEFSPSTEMLPQNSVSPSAASVASFALYRSKPNNTGGEMKRLNFDQDHPSGGSA